ncbi:DUF1365 domain-containing protein [Roseibium suaedae]|uniref:DUF1365 domain-containing protein n=1 Tax=Roseibium suaedae TaxID=735517 RepID=A0A1M7FA91_9HYPH|nr:DUF1365 domain-containing protein [Roseibium suaedae]SHM00577.1 hypothetical protein SAMN05444272_1540 [Roseibium suaedae]
MTRAAQPASMSDNGPPPGAALTLYAGPVMHARMKPEEHRFTYDVFSILIDLDHLEAADRMTPLFSVGRFNLSSFHARDHGPRDGSSLRAHADRLLEAEGVERPARVLLLCYPRILGYVFNPLAVYYAYDAAGALTGVIYEVRNTFGGIHHYVLGVKDGELSEAGLRQQQDKLFYVSPFVSMEQTYRFRLLPPGEAVRIRILESDKEGPLLSATFNGTARPFTSASLLKLCAKIPFLPLKVMAGIHWEAFKIWRKGVRFHPRPANGSSGKTAPDETRGSLKAG